MADPSLWKVPFGSEEDDWKSKQDAHADQTAANVDEIAALAALVGGAPAVNPSSLDTHRAATTAGTGAAYTLSFSPAFTSQPQGVAFKVRWHLANTGAAPTLKLDALTTWTLKGRGGASLAIGDLKLDGTDWVVSNPTLGCWEVITAAPPAPAPSVLPATIAPYAGRSAPSGWLLCYGQAISRTTYADLFAVLHESATITMTIASPCVVTWPGRTWVEGEPIKFSTTGTLPTGLVAGTAYYVKSPSGNTCNVAATPGGTAINTSGSQSGIHAGICAPFGNGDGSTTFNVPDFRGRSPIGKDNLGGTSANVVTAALADALGGTGGAETHTLTTAEMPAHSHNYGGSQQTVAGGGYTSQNEGSAWATSSTGGGAAHANMSPWLAVNWIIKT